MNDIIVSEMVYSVFVNILFLVYNNLVFYWLIFNEQQFSVLSPVFDGFIDFRQCMQFMKGEQPLYGTFDNKDVSALNVHVT